MPAAISIDESVQQEIVSPGVAPCAPAPVFDRIARLAAQVFAAPLSAITLVDSYGYQFKSLGRNGHDSFDDRAFSAYAISQKEPFVVLDPLGDVRFRNQPLVTGRSAVRFYIAAPLISRAGRVIGSLHVADTKVRLYVLPAQRAALKDLAAISVFELEQCGRSS